MTTYVALLRGINVGRANRVAMADLRILLSDLGFEGVRTLLQSGNAVFEARGAEDDLAVAIEQALQQRTGVSARCLVRTGTGLADVVAANPFPDVPDGSRLMVHFVSAPLEAAAREVRALDPDNVGIVGRAVYQWCPDGILAAPDVGSYLIKQLGETTTARNANTVTELVAMV